MIRKYLITLVGVDVIRGDINDRDDDKISFQFSARATKNSLRYGMLQSIPYLIASS